MGRTIQGHTLPMLVEQPCAAPLDALAELARNGLLLIGPPNVGKTTVLRELARLLSDGDRRVVVVVDKSLEIAGTGVVPHAAIGHARVLTVEHPAQQHRVMLEAVENQSPDGDAHACSCSRLPFTCPRLLFAHVPASLSPQWWWSTS